MNNPNFTLVKTRAIAALKLTYVADALAMPVHWFYNPQDIFKAFPGGIHQFEAAPQYHPHDFLKLPPTQGNQIVCDVILKDKRKYWGIPHQHVHQGMQAGENTLNACCARLVTRALIENGGHYNATKFLEDYIAFMTSDAPQHPDTYAEAYHRDFFKNFANGLPPKQCGQLSEETASVGGLVTIAPVAFAELLAERNLNKVQAICREHMWLTHPDKELAKICDAYVKLIDALLFRDETTDAKDIIAKIAQESCGVSLRELCEKSQNDNDIIGGTFAKACPILDSWPSVLYLAFKYNNDPMAAFIANIQVGGDNCHRGSVLGVILGLCNADALDALFARLTQSAQIEQEIKALIR